MRYTVIHMDWRTGMHGKEIQYSISEIAAISLDEDLHTVDTFRFLLEQSNGYVRSEKHFEEDKVFVAGADEGWAKFREWYHDQDYLVAWEQNIREIFVHCNQIHSKRRFQPKYICVCELFDKMTLGIPKESGKISGAMEILGLKCEVGKLNKPLYCAQALVRMFRKLCMLGRKEMGARFHHGLAEGDYFYLSQKDYFPKLREKLLRERNRQIRKMITDAGYMGSVISNHVTIDTKTSYWKFDISERNPQLQYYTKSYYRGMRRQDTSFKGNVDWKDKMKDILMIIEETDRKYLIGVGSEEIKYLVDQIAQKMVKVIELNT